VNADATESSKKSTSIFYAAVACEALVLCGLVVSAWDCRFAVARHVLFYVATAAPFAVALFAASSAKLPGLWGVLLLSAGLRIIALTGPVLLSDDIYRYVWDGRVNLAGFDPYAHPPAAEELSALRDDTWNSINHPELRTIYPAGAQAIFLSLAWLGPHPKVFRVAMGLFDLGVVAFVFLLAVRRAPIDASWEARNHRAGKAALTYGLCPLACVESAMSGHLDSAALLAFLGALALLPPKQKNGFWSGAMLGMGAAIKLAPALLLPVLARRRWSLWLGFGLTVTLCYLPFAFSGAAAFETLDAFARKWEANAGPFALAKLGFEKVIAVATGASSTQDMVHLRFLDSAAQALDPTFFSLHKDGPMDPLRPGAFPVSDLALACAKLLGVLVLVVVYAKAWQRRECPLESAYLVLGALVLVSPVLHPWYVLWVLPVAAVRGSYPWFAFAAAVPLGYLPLKSWWTMGVWREPAWSLGVQTGVLLAAYGFDVLSRKKRVGVRCKKNAS
jgi:hypothetical protein